MSALDHIDPAKRVMRFKAVAEELGISSETLRKMCKRGQGLRVLQLSQHCLGVRRSDFENLASTAGEEVVVTAPSVGGILSN